MRGDFSRGHRPDLGRGQPYRRVLTQQGRVWLDSDAAAAADAGDQLIRHLAAATGCPAGSPDTGFLTSPGRAFAWFDSVDHVSGLPPQGDPFRAFRDYHVKYMERLPSLYLDARVATAPVTVRGRAPISVVANTRLRLWMKREAAATPIPTLTIAGAVITPPAGAVAGDFGFDAYDYQVAGVATFEGFELQFSAAGADNQLWVGFAEVLEDADQKAKFWVTHGRYYVDGIEVAWPQDGQSLNFLPLVDDNISDVVTADGLFAVYLEVWERLVTHVEEPGLRDRALGGLDTTVRTRPIGQVKVADLTQVQATLAGNIAGVLGAFDNFDRGLGTLDVKPALIPPDPDPCAIPVAGGYTAEENRLYRFEVYKPGDLATASLTWSRSNGSELYGVTLVDAPNGVLRVHATPGTAPPMQLLDNDLVELVSERVDLGDEDVAPGDAGRAVIDLDPAGPSFKPSSRRRGVLALVRSTPTEGVFRLIEPGGAVPEVPVSLAADAVRLRKWDGLITSTAAPSVHTLEDGLQVEFTGSDYRRADYWQYEARRLGNNASTPSWVAAPHGPERLFAPLALFKIGPDASTPTELQHWFDDRFRPICELRADDIYYDGAKSGTEADTVQEAIDELYELVQVDGGGCCDITIEPAPNPVDDTGRIQAVIDAMPARGTICLKRGVYVLLGKLTIAADQDITFDGCPEAIIEGQSADDPVFEVQAQARLVLCNLIVRQRAIGAVIAVAERATGPELRATIEIRDCKLAQIAGGAVVQDISQIVDPVYAVISDAVVQLAPAQPSFNVIELKIERSKLLGFYGLHCQKARRVVIDDSHIAATRAVIALRASPGAAGAALRLRDSTLATVYDVLLHGVTIGAVPSDEIGNIVDIVLSQLTTANPDSVVVGSPRANLEADRCTLRGACAVAITEGTVTLRRCALIGATARALWGDRTRCIAEETSFDSAQYLAVHLMQPPVLNVVRCNFSGIVGLVLWVRTDLKTPIVSDSWSVIQVERSNFSIPNVSSADIVGSVLIGPVMPIGESVGTSEARVSWQFDRNNLSPRFVGGAYTFGLSCNMISKATPLPHPLQVMGNTVAGAAHVGILCHGPASRVEGNELMLKFETGDFVSAAVAILGTPGHVLDNNTVVVDGDPAQTVVGVLLWSGVGKSPSDTRVSHNAVRDLRVPKEVLAIYAFGTGVGTTERLTVEANRVEGSWALFADQRDLVVRGNHFDLELAFAMSVQNVSFVDNEVTGPDLVGRLLILGGSGLLRVAHNAARDILVRPESSGAKEIAYRAQVVDNHALRELQVGIPNGSPDSNSRVQVLGNSSLELYVNNYLHAIVSNNMADNFTPAPLAASAVAAAIRIHNHNL